MQYQYQNTGCIQSQNTRQFLLTLEDNFKNKIISNNSLILTSRLYFQGLFQFWRPKREMKELDNCGKRYVGKKSNKDKRDCLWDCEVGSGYFRVIF